MIKRFMMKRYISIIVLLVLALGAMAQGKEPMAFTAFFKNGMDKVEGILPVYKGADKYYLEIPMNLLGREMFFSGVVTRGTGIPYAMTEGMGVAVFKAEPGNRVSLSKGILENGFPIRLQGCIN